MIDAYDGRLATTARLFARANDVLAELLGGRDDIELKGAPAESSTPAACEDDSDIPPVAVD